ERRFDVPLVVGKADLADEAAAVFLADHPVAVAEQRPVPGIAQQPRPNLFAAKRLSADKARNGLIGPQGVALVEVLTNMRTQDQTIGFKLKDGRIHRAYPAGAGREESADDRRYARRSKSHSRAAR